MTGFEPLIAAATAGLTSLITDVIKETGGKLLERFDKNLPSIRNASRQYVQNYTERHGSLKVVCVRMDESIRLDQIYVAAKFLNRSDLTYYESVSGLQKLYQQQGKRELSLSSGNKQDGIAIANQAPYLMVLGGPGVGKSTFIRKVGLEALKRKQGEFQYNCLPVFLALQRFRSSDITLEQLISKELEICDFPDPDVIAKAMLQKGKLLVLLDGLDEVAGQYQDYVITQIQDFVDRYSNNRFIASCRIAAYKGGFPRFKDVAMAPFENEQIEQFIRSWFRSEKDREIKVANQCLKLLRRPEYAATRELAKTPLLLALLCAVYDKSLNFPKNRSALYGEALDVLLKEWAAEKRIQHDPIYQQLSLELERELLADIAYESFFGNQLFFDKRFLSRKIKEFLVNNLNAPKHLDSEKVLEAIEVQQGILVERARDVYSFSHLTFQEYLTAQYVVDNQQIEQLVSNYLNKEQWREVFLLVAGLMPGRQGGDQLLLLIERRMQLYIQAKVKPLKSEKSPELPKYPGKSLELPKYSKLGSLFQWLDESTTNSEGSQKPLTKRIVAFYLVNYLVSTITLSLSLSRARALNTNINYNSSVDKMLSNTFNLASALDYNIAKNLIDKFKVGGGGLIDSPLSENFSLNIYLVQIIAESKIFKSVNFVRLIAKLKVLKSKVPDSNQPYEILQDYANQILKIWFEELKFHSGLVNFSDTETKELSNYFYVGELMARCKEAAVRVSPQVWDSIESRILSLNGEVGKDRNT